MDDAEITALAEQAGLTGPIDDVVAWARQRTDELVAEGLDADLGALLEGRPVVVENTQRTPRPARVETQPGVPLPPQPLELQRAPLPPVPQRPDLAQRSPQDSADDLEMLDEDDLELVEDLSESGDDGESNGREPDADGGDDDTSNGTHAEAHVDDPPADAAASHEPGPAVSSPEWKRALADAQGE